MWYCGKPNEPAPFLREMNGCFVIFPYQRFTVESHFAMANLAPVGNATSLLNKDFMRDPHLLLRFRLHLQVQAVLTGFGEEHPPSHSKN